LRWLDFFRETRDKAGDPVTLGDGSFTIQVADLAFPGPVRPLEFRRVYNSRSRERSALGSNWQHNWDMRIQPLQPDTAPAWALPYCAGASTLPTCLLLHEASGGVQLFFFDLQSRLYMPQAGSTATIAATPQGGWALREADGHLFTFNHQGYLTEDRDRFGNGFTLRYEPTPLGELYDYFCNPTALAARNETKSSRRCAVLAYLLDDAARPDTRDAAWTVSETDYTLTGVPAGDSARLRYARAYFLYVLQHGTGVQSAFGGHRLRPVQVIDDLGRTLTFSYYQAPPVPNPPTGGSGFDFAHVPQAELLEAVSGPGGTHLHFVYGQPPNYPAALNEWFLTGVDRHDSAGAQDVEAAADRHAVYRYQWPGTYGQDAVPSYDSDTFAATVFSRYRDYYTTFVGCTYAATVSGCSGQFMPPKVAWEDPVGLANLEMNGYIGDVADNILEVTNNGQTESESRYVVDPFAPAFDRVVAQRYGSSQAQQDPALLPADAADDHWQTTLPKAVLAYQGAGPAGNGDLTDAVLPKEIRDRYPLETAQTTPVAPPPTIAIGIAGTVHLTTTLAACNYPSTALLMSRLPGYQSTLAYTDSLASEIQPDVTRPLYRSRLTCDQLALAQFSDPTHNDLISTLEPITSTATLTDHIAIRLVGRRPTIAANTNRICSWSRLIDRDGDEHYYGLNYRGQVLADGVRQRSTSTFLFTDRLYNADGLVVQERRPSSGPQPWPAAAGYTAYTYDEIDPRGNGGWNDWLPVFWSRRMNLLRVEEHPAGINVLDDQERPATGLTPSLGRYQRFEYEPLFNQLRSVEDGSLQWGPGSFLRLVQVDVPNARTDYVFDYQELTLTGTTTLTPTLAPVLDALQPWGFNWLTKVGPNRKPVYDYAAIAAWQLPLPFYDRDMNGDGRQGFGFGSAAGQARGVAIASVRRASASPALSQTSTLTWAPQGLPAAIHGPDDTMTIFEYYPHGTGAYGQNRPPTNSEVNIGFRGLLGRVRTQRFGSSYPVAYAPPGHPCPALAGPYGWLLPATCTDPPAELRALGLPQEAVDAILRASTTTSGDRWMTTTFSYSELGLPRYTWTDTGTIHVVRDPDGRPIVTTDPLGNTIANTYTVRGYLERAVITDTQGVLLSDTYQQFDDEGRVTYVCAAMHDGGCVPRGAPHPAAGMVTRYEYWPEGGLRATIDPEGLRTETGHNERQLITTVRAWTPGKPNPLRETYYTYTPDGDVQTVHYGAAALGPPDALEEHYAYDGLRRMTTYTDTRSYAWQAAYSPRDLLTRYKRADVPYSGAGGATPAWETEWRYDGLGRAEARIDNGVTTAVYSMTLAGTTYATTGAGAGPSYTTYDLQGRPVWSRDPAGTQLVYTWSPAPHLSTAAEIRTQGTSRLTTVTVDWLDAAERAVQEGVYGSGNWRYWQWTRDGAGFVREVHDPDNVLTGIHRNLLGWPLEIAEQRTTANPASLDISRFTYNQRGQVLTFTDPTTTTTEFDYDPFGAITARRSPGQPRVVNAFFYDPLGRVDLEYAGQAVIKHFYDGRGDPIGESLLDQGVLVPLATRTYDELGRVLTARNFNPALSALPEADRTVTERMDYDALGRVRLDSLQVGTVLNHDVQSTWRLAAPDAWQRDVHYQAGLDEVRWRETLDGAGRLARKERVVAGGAALATTFNWLGDIYTGRVQAQSGHASPFREERTVDPFGSLLDLRYRAIDLQADGAPIDAAEGAAYCGGSWNVAACGQPLFASQSLHDTMNRVASVTAQFGYPVIVNSRRIAVAHPQSWQGYTYTPQGQLDHAWDDPGGQGPVPTAGLGSPFVTANDIARLGQHSPQWAYQRNPTGGDLEAIRNVATGADRWALVAPRSPGHQIQQVAVDGITRTLSYDASGRVEVDGPRTYFYDPRGQLAGVVANGVVVEGYVYDDWGRLAGVLRGNPMQPAQVFAYDGDQMVAAFDAQNRPLWEAAWGASVDQLIEWRDHAGGTGDTIPLVDRRNSIVGAWNVTQGRVTQTGEYDPEGRITVRSARRQTLCREEHGSGPCPNPGGQPFGFLSAWRSPVSGLVYLRNRWYSADLGQFISQDPAGYRDSYNPYAYANSDPINGWDPFGLEARGFAAVTELPPMAPSGPGGSIGPGLDGIGPNWGGWGGRGWGGQGYDPTPYKPYEFKPYEVELLEPLFGWLLRSGGVEAGGLLAFLWPSSTDSERMPTLHCAQQVCGAGTDFLRLPPVRPSAPITEPQPPRGPVCEPCQPGRIEAPPDRSQSQAPIQEPEPPAAPLAAGKPNAARQGDVQYGWLNPLTNEWEDPPPEGLQADHFIAEKIIRGHWRFKLLMEQQQLKILNDPINFQGLPGSFNKSKGSKWPRDWTEYKGIYLDKNYVTGNRRMERIIWRTLQNEMDRMIRENQRKK
jgi:RHS repeat-associated protein